jgi:PAS domain S-box-containing protein
VRIRSQFIITTAIFGIVILIIAASVIGTNQQLVQIEKQQQISGNIESGSDKLNTLSSQYFLYQQTQQLTLWNSNSASISGNLSNLNPTNLEQKTLMNKINGDLAQLNSSFTNLVSYLETTPRNVSVRVLPEFQNYWNLTVTAHQTFGLDAFKLSDYLRTQADQLRQTNLVLVIALSAVFGSFFLIGYLITYRRTLKSISNLQKGIKIIGSGNLDYSIQTKKEDEIAELSQTFNQMATDLKTVTASKADLENEIVGRKKAEEAIRESELRLRFHAENTPLAVVEWDSNFVVTRWAGEAEKMFGWNDSETIGNPIMDLHIIYEPDIPIVEETMKRLMSGEPRVVSSNRNITKDGRMIYCTWYNSVLRNYNGKVVSVFSFVEDNTSKVKAEEALKENNRNLELLIEERTKQLKDSERLATIGATAGMVGHDIRNPLQAITSDVYLLKQELLQGMPEREAKNSAKESLEGIEKNVDYINKIVADLQDFARPLSPRIEEVNLKLIIGDLLVENGLPENVKVTVRVEAAAEKIMADSTFISRIMFNLVNNAVQAMPEGGKLTISAFKDENDVLITVKDTGVGIPEKVKDKLFAPMFTTKSKGQGFGLAVIKRLTEALGGKVTFESQENKGTTFIVCLPLPSS